MIQFNNVTIIFNQNKENECKALDGLSFDIQKGEFVSMRGRSGCGKSTALKIIAALEKQTSGEVFVDDINIAELNETKQAIYRNKIIGYVHQEFMLMEGSKVYENVIMPLYFTRSSYASKKQKVADALDKVGMLDFSNKYVWQLSGGEKQRVAFARALINNPKLLLADEPTGALDAENTDKILKLTKKLNEEGMTVLLVTHDDYASSFASREIILDYGKIKI